MFVIVAYAPILLLLPVLLLVGVVFVVVPGGFIIVLAGLYYAADGFTSLLGLEVTQAVAGPRSRVRRAEHRASRTRRDRVDRHSVPGEPSPRGR